MIKCALTTCGIPATVSHRYKTQILSTNRAMIKEAISLPLITALIGGYVGGRSSSKRGGSFWSGAVPGALIGGAGGAVIAPTAMGKWLTKAKAIDPGSYSKVMKSPGFKRHMERTALGAKRQVARSKALLQMGKGKKPMGAFDAMFDNDPRYRKELWKSFKGYMGDAWKDVKNPAESFKSQFAMHRFDIKHVDKAKNGVKTLLKKPEISRKSGLGSALSAYQYWGIPAVLAAGELKDKNNTGPGEKAVRAGAALASTITPAWIPSMAIWDSPKLIYKRKYNQDGNTMTMPVQQQFIDTSQKKYYPILDKGIPFNSDRFNYGS